MSRPLGCFVFFFAGCGFAGSVDVADLQNRCESDDDCANGHCDSALLMCVSEAPASLRLGLDVRTVAGQVADTTFTRIFDLSVSARHDVALPKTVSIVGTVLWDGLADQYVDAQIEVVSPSDSPDRAPSRFSVITNNGFTAPDGELATFQVTVFEGRTYQLEVTPVGQAARELPPARFTVNVPTNEFAGDAILRFDPTYPPMLTEVAGDIVAEHDEIAERQDCDGDTVRTTNALCGVDGLQVVAIHGATGLPVSSTSETMGIGPGSGHFLIRLAPEVPPSFYIQVLPGSGQRVFPRVTIDSGNLFPGGSGNRLDARQVLVPTLREIRYGGSVEGAFAAGRAPVENAIVRFRSDAVFDNETGVVGSYETTALTSVMGQFNVVLFPGVYTVVGQSSGTDDELGIVVEEVTISQSAEPAEPILGQLFTLPRRARLGGTVMTGEQAVENVVIEAEPQIDSALARRSQASSDATGRFDLGLDIGTYDVTIHMPQQTGFPWMLVRDIEVQQVGAPIGTMLVDLEAPVPVRGVVTDATGAPLDHAQITAWVSIMDAAGETRTLNVGRVETNDRGEYLFLCPPRILPPPTL